MCAPAPHGMMEHAEREEAMGLRSVKGGLGSSSLSVNVFSPSRANPWNKPLMASGLSTCPYFFQLVRVCMFMFLLLALRESTSPFHEDLM